MKTLKQNLFVIFAVLLAMLITSEANGTLLLDKTTVVIKNDIPGESITIHCHSSEEDLGVHALSYSTNFTWHFRMNIWGSKKFYCDLTTKHGSGNYGVFTRKLEANVCDKCCLWLIKAGGPCLHQTVDQDRLWCQGWKTPPSSEELPNLREYQARAKMLFL